MVNAGNLRDELDDLLRLVSLRPIYSMLHLPIQSGDDGVLQRMNRSYSASEIKSIFTRIREIDPRITLHTDVIVGFPGESEEGFKNTVDLIEWMQPDVMNLSKFSPRPGTAAVEMKSLPSHIIKERSKILANLRSSISFELNKRLIGEVFNVLTLKELGNGKWFGRTDSYKPVVFEGSSTSLGDFMTVHIDGATRTHLVGYQCF
jgi:tRNA A37 methylthiotransferase MiaB